MPWLGVGERRMVRWGVEDNLEPRVEGQSRTGPCMGCSVIGPCCPRLAEDRQDYGLRVGGGW